MTTVPPAERERPREYPLLFSGAMVRALLAGTKTQTRRLDKRWMKVKAGDRLWVRETHARFCVGEGPDSPVPECVAYRATCDDGGRFDYVNGRGEAMNLAVTKWTPSIFMPRWASRLTLTATADARLERLQDISPRDVIAEGIDYDQHKCGCERCAMTSQICPATGSSLVMEYAELWDGINPKTPWASHPEVVVLTFARLP